MADRVAVLEKARPGSGRHGRDADPTWRGTAGRACAVRAMQQCRVSSGTDGTSILASSLLLGAGLAELGVRAA
jgi:hypothetical protein